jgi:hypothetical protein
MEVSSSTRSVSPPPAKARPPERNRSQDYAAEQQKVAARPQQTEAKKPQPVVNTQGQSIGRIVNTKA